MEIAKPKSVNFHGYEIYENGVIIGLQGREIKKRINNGRYEIQLTAGDKRKSFLVSRLMYRLFFPFDASDKDLCVSHKDGDKLNIDLSNLFLIHRRDLIQGDKHTNRAKLSNKQVKEIRELYTGQSGTSQHDKVGYSLQDLADEYGVTKGNIAMIIRGETRNKKEYIL